MSSHSVVRKIVGLVLLTLGVFQSPLYARKQLSALESASRVERKKAFETRRRTVEKKDVKRATSAGYKLK